MSEKTDVTHELYQELLAAWLVGPSISRVALGVGVPRSVVEQLVKNGAPELGLPPFPPAKDVKKQDRTTPPEVKVDRVIEPDLQPDISGSGELSLSARVALARQDAERTIGELRAKLESVEEEARKLGDTAAVAEARATLDGTLADFQAAEARVRVEEARISKVGRAVVVHDRLQLEAKKIAVAEAAMQNVLNLGVIMSYMTDRLLAAVEAGDVELPATVNTRVLASLAGSADRLTMAMERAANLQKNLPQATDSLGMRIGRVLESLTPEEREEVRRTGRLPARRVGSGE